MPALPIVLSIALAHAFARVPLLDQPSVTTTKGDLAAGPPIVDVERAPDGALTPSSPRTARLPDAGLVLDPFQVEAIAAIEAGHTVLVAAPTGSGKTVIAEHAIEQALSRGRRAIYTSPIKALSNQKFRDFGARHGDKVGLVTGDVSLNADAPVLVMTTEIFRNAILESPERYHDVDFVIMDEVHYIDDSERGTVWEESLIFAPPQIRFVALSATIPNVLEIAHWIEDIRASKVVVVVERTRPVPLEFRFCSAKAGHFGIDALKDRFGSRQPPGRRSDRRPSRPDVEQARRTATAILDVCQREGRMPALYFAFNRRECEAKAWQNRRRKLLNSAERAELTDMIEDLTRRYGLARHLEDGRLVELWRNGIAYHHAGILPTIKEVIERLFTAGLIKLMFATETFAVGINMPACSVIFDAIEKFDGTDFRPLRVLEFQQMAGRAGRRGMDAKGWVHVNLDALENVGYRQLREILSGRVEPINSQLNLGYSTILNLRSRLGDEVYRAADKSLGAFQGRGGSTAEVAAQTAERREQLARRLRLLETLGYLEPTGELTGRGRFAAQIQGYELQATELVYAGVLEPLDARELAVVLGSLCFEGKKRHVFVDRFADVVRPLEKKVVKEIRRLRQAEGRLGIVGLSSAPDFQIGGAIYAWASGAELTDLADLTNLPLGDLVRAIRLTVQMLRQVRHASRGHVDLVERLDRSIASLKRDEADAEAQLRVQ